jgi:hypothetical protein
MVQMPRRLLLIESADTLEVVDAAAARSTELYDGRAGAAGIVLADIASGCMRITSTS